MGLLRDLVLVLCLGVMPLAQVLMPSISTSALSSQVPTLHAMYCLDAAVPREGNRRWTRQRHAWKQAYCNVTYFHAKFTFAHLNTHVIDALATVHLLGARNFVAALNANIHVELHDGRGSKSRWLKVSCCLSPRERGIIKNVCSISLSMFFSADGNGNNARGKSTS